MIRSDAALEPRRARGRSLRAFVALLTALAGASCGPATGKFPWAESATTAPAEHAGVRTSNAQYRRIESHVLVREVERPTRALLDYAAYHQNFMIAQAAPEGEGETAPTAQPDTSNPFAGLIDRASLTESLDKLGLSQAERAAPLAFTPVL